MRRVKVGDVFGLLTVTAIIDVNGEKTAVCRCECNQECRKKTSTMSQLGGKSLQASCGCLQKAMARQKIIEARSKRTPEGLEKIKENVRKGRKIIDPTEDEIAQRCLEVQATWPPERFAKYDSGCRPVEIKVCRGGSEAHHAERLN